MSHVTIEDYNKFLVTSLEACDAEKKLMMVKFDELENAQLELGDLRTEILQRSNELHRTQQELSEQRVLVSEEREKVARLMNENAVLQAQLQDDRTKIAALSRLRSEELKAQSLMQGSYPVRVSVLRGNGTPNRGAEQHSLSLRSVVSDAPVAHVDVSTTVTDVSTPPGSGLVAALSKEVSVLKGLLDDQRKSYENERALRVLEERTRNQQQEEALSKYNKAIDHMQRLLNDGTKELVTFRHEAQIRERTLRGEVEALTARLSEMERSLAIERNKQSAAMQAAIENANHRSHDVVAQLRAKAVDKEEAFAIEKERLEHTIQSLQKQVDSLQKKLQDEKKKKKRMVERHRFENEGMQTDINLMKQHLRAVEKKVYFHAHQQQHE